MNNIGISINQVITKYYSDLYKKDKKEVIKHVLDTKTEKEPPFLENEIKAIVKHLKPNKSPGHDNITGELIKMRGKTIAKILIELFNIIMETGITSKSWKFSDIIILFKKGDRHKIENYRPITLTPNNFKYFFKSNRK